MRKMLATLVLGLTLSLLPLVCEAELHQAKSDDLVAATETDTAIPGLSHTILTGADDIVVVTFSGRDVSVFNDDEESRFVAVRVSLKRSGVELPTQGVVAINLPPLSGVSVPISLTSFDAPGAGSHVYTATWIKAGPGPAHLRFVTMTGRSLQILTLPR